MEEIEKMGFLVKESPLREECFQNWPSQRCVGDRGLVVWIKISSIFSETRNGVVISPPEIILNRGKS